MIADVLAHCRARAVGARTGAPARVKSRYPHDTLAPVPRRHF